VVILRAFTKKTPLQRTDLSVNEREETYWAIHDYFGREALKDVQ
jgi:hypothetical protein